MKMIKTMMLVLAGCLTFISCSDDDDANDNNPLNKSIEGAYRLTSAILPAAQDLDNDGDSTTNAVMEGPCYNDSWISFHGDGTYDGSLTTSTTTALGSSLTCDTQAESGTYTVSGSTITTVAAGSADTKTFNFDADSRTVSMTDVNADYPSFNAVTSLWSTANANIQYTFTKYTDDSDDNGDSADTNGDNDDENNAHFWLLGEFSLTSFVVPVAQNLDNDADTSTNLTSESSCYGQSYISFQQNGTYEEERTMPVIADSMLSLSCTTENTAGTWTHSGNTVTTTRIGAGSGSATRTYTLDANTHLLTRTDAAAIFPGFTTATSLYAMITGNVNYTYTRN